LKDAAAAESTLKRGAEEAANQLKAMLDTANLENQYLSYISNSPQSMVVCDSQSDYLNL
jgi:hypothetical protein